LKTRGSKLHSNDIVIDFIYGLYCKKISLWLQEQTIRAFIPPSAFLTDSEKEFIRDNKQHIISVLHENNMHKNCGVSALLKNTSLSPYPLSYSQERVWFVEQFEQGSSVYNIPRVYNIAKSANLDILKESLCGIVDRHEILRSYIKTDLHGVGYQIPDVSYRSTPIKTLQVKSVEELEQFINKDVHHTFDLENEYPIKINFYQLSNHQGEEIESYLVIVFHHIASDGWSMGLFVHELNDFYSALVDFSTPKLPDLGIQYKDFAVWQRKLITKDSLKEQLNYWTSTLDGYEILCLEKSKTRPKEMNYTGENLTFDLDAKTSSQLRLVAKTLNISLYTLLLGGYFVLLNYLTNQNDIIIGTVIANRNSEQLENLIGFFVNTLPLRIHVEGHEKFIDFISLLKSNVLNGQINQDVPFEKLIDHLNVPSDITRHPLFQVMFVSNDFVTETSYPINNILKPYDYNPTETSAKFDITTSWDECETHLKCNFNFQTQLFNKETIKRYIAIYNDILVAIASSIPSNSIHTLTVDSLIDSISSNESSLPIDYIEEINDETLVSLFENQALLTPQAIAITDVKTQRNITYGQLASDIEKIAAFIVSICKETNNQLIGILSEKGYNHAVASLSIMKSGHAYLPLHHDWPVHRINDVLVQGNVSILLVSKHCFLKDNLENVFNNQYKLIIIEDLLQSLSREIVTANTLPSVKPSDIAYVIFTSGSTGVPKGVTISHRGAANTLRAINQKYTVNANDSILALSELSFDLSVYDIFGLLSIGGRVVFPDSDYVKDPGHWLDLIKRYNISLWNSVPQLAGLFIEELDQHIECLRLFLLSGDWIPLKLPESIINKCPNAKTISLGGATEGSIWSIWYEINEIQEDWSSIPYGVAMPNQGMLVLSDGLKHCPTSVIGEIHIAGEGVALGYWGDEERTNERFINTEHYGRLYKTGDLGRWNQNGYIEFIGRQDSQVKLNGYRIELDEISINLAKLDHITDVVSILIKHNEKDYICSYYVGLKQDEKTLLEKLHHVLPDYMLPTSLIYLDKMPLTANGKLDRQALPHPNFSIKRDDFKPPRNAMEAKMCTIFANVLGLVNRKIGIYNDFFHLGGDSIASIRLISLLRKELNIVVTAKDIFTYKTVSSLYEKLVTRAQRTETHHKITAEQGMLVGGFDLLPIQNWFFSTNVQNAHYFNHAFLIKVPCLDIAILQESINQLVAFHDVFRLRFNIRNVGHNIEYEQYYSDRQTAILLKMIDVREWARSQDTLSQILTDLQSKFNLSDGPVCSVAYLNGYEDETARIHIAIHHLLIDTVSWHILTNDLKKIYQSISNGLNTTVLDEKRTSYRQWVTAVQQYSLDNQDESVYWKRMMDDYSKYPPLNCLMEMINKVHYCESSLDEKNTAKLISETNRPYNTQINDLLLSALAYTLTEVTKNNVNYITLEGHGREELNENIDISETLGWFTTMYPIRLEANLSSGMASTIKLTKENLRSIPNKGIGYGALIGLDSIELPKITFNYLGKFDQQESDTYWYIVNEHAGRTVASKNIEHNVISINAAVIGGKFVISFKCKLHQTITNLLANRYIGYLEQLVDYLTDQARPEYTMSDFADYEPHIAISHEEQSQPLIILPPGIGGYECYLNNIVPQLDNSLILFNNFNVYLRHKLDSDSSDYICFENLAESYIAHLKTIQPTGPYALFGWSFGGVLAFEMCKQLIRSGNEVSHLFMVDPYFNVRDVFKQLNSQDNEIETVGHLNYKYNPTDSLDINQVPITLFKATVKYNNDSNNLFNYYAMNEEYNCLDKIIPKESISVHPILDNHFSWVNNDNVVMQIANYINKYMKISH